MGRVATRMIKIIKLQNQIDDLLISLNEKLANLLEPSGNDAFLTYQSGDGWVITWDILNTRVTPSELEALLKMDYETAKEWLEDRSF
jgi:hypothetical protein